MLVVVDVMIFVWEYFENEVMVKSCFWLVSCNGVEEKKRGWGRVILSWGSGNGFYKVNFAESEC